MALKKVINSATQQFEPVLVDKLVLDAVPTVNSFNSVTSDAVARAVAGASGEVPQVTSEDNGKFLKAIYDEGGAAVEWDTVEVPTVDQTYNASSTNAQSGVAVAQAITASDKVSTSQTSQTEIDIDVNGNAPIKLIAEDYGSVAGPATQLEFSSATYSDGMHGHRSGIHVVFNLPTTQKIPLSARITVNQDVVGSDIRYGLSAVVFDEAIDGYVETTNIASNIINGIISSGNTILAGDYDVSLTSGNPNESFSQVGFLIDGGGTSWPDFVDYVISNASTLFSMSVTTTVKAARLLPAASSNDVSKVLTVSVSGKPGWATPPTVNVDQTYNALSENPQSGTAVAGAIATVKQVPASTASDSSKVLTVNASGNPEWQTAQGGGGGASVEAGAGLVKSGDTLSVDAGNGLRFGSIKKAVGYGYNYISTTAAIMTSCHYINLTAQPYDNNWSGDLPEYASIYILNNIPGQETVRARYTSKTFNVVLSDNRFKIEGFPGGVQVDFYQSNVTMETGTWTDLVSGLPSPTVYIAFGYVNSSNTISYFNGLYGELYDNGKLSVIAPIPDPGTAHAEEFISVNASTSQIVWRKSTFMPVYSLSTTKPTYTVDGNKITIAAADNAPLRDSISGFYPSSGDTFVHKLVAFSMGLGFESSSHDEENVTLKITYNFGSSYKVVLFEQSVVDRYYTNIFGTHNVWANSGNTFTSITIEAFDSNGSAINFPTTWDAIIVFGIATQRLP